MSENRGIVGRGTRGVGLDHAAPGNSAGTYLLFRPRCWLASTKSGLKITVEEPLGIFFSKSSAVGPIRLKFLKSTKLRRLSFRVFLSPTLPNCEFRGRLTIAHTNHLSKRLLGPLVHIIPASVKHTEENSPQFWNNAGL